MIFGGALEKSFFFFFLLLRGIRIIKKALVDVQCDKDEYHRAFTVQFWRRPDFQIFLFFIIDSVINSIINFIIIIGTTTTTIIMFVVPTVSFIRATL